MISSEVRYSINQIRKEEESSLVIYGVNGFGKELQQTLAIRDIYIKYMIDALTESLKPCCQDFSYVIAGINAYEKKDMIHTLINNGVPEKNIIVPLPYYGEHYFTHSLLRIPEFAAEVFWMHYKKKKEAGADFSEYFLFNNIHSIQFYGDVKIAEMLKSAIGTAVAVVENGYDAIVVTDVASFDFIEEKLMDKVDCPIISAWEVVKW